MLRTFKFLGYLLFIFTFGCATPKNANQNKKSDEEVAQMYSELGTSALLRGDYSQAIEDLRKSLSVDSHNAMAHNHLGLAYYGLGKKDLAKQELLQAVKVDPKYSDAYVNLGAFAFEEGDKANARLYYRKALDNLEYKLRHRALTNLAQVALTEDKIDEARELLYQSLQANPDYCMTHFFMGTILMRENNPKRAAEEFKSSVSKTCVQNPEGHYQLGLAYMRSKQYDKARSQFAHLIEDYPQTAQAERAGELLKDIP